jgi:hypothetical protein
VVADGNRRDTTKDGIEANRAVAAIAREVDALDVLT